MSENKSIVLELLQDVMKSDCDTVNVLRKAHVIATKLDLDKFDSWLKSELYGYSGNDSVPEYRHIRGQLKAFVGRNWLVIPINDELGQKKLDEIDVIDPITKLICFLKDGKDEFDPAQPRGFQKLCENALNNRFPPQYAICISRDSVYALVESVKSTVLEWTMRLAKEKILGNGFEFTPKERENASLIPQTININIGEGATVSQLITGNNNQVNFRYKDLAKAMSEINSAIDKDEAISEDYRESAKKMLADINSKIGSEAEPKLIKSLLTLLKELLVGAGGSLTADLIKGIMQIFF